MKRKQLKTTCNIISVLLVVAFIIKTFINYFQYNELVNSAPFSIWILVNALYLIVPAIVIFIIGLLIKQ